MSDTVQYRVIRVNSVRRSRAVSSSDIIYIGDNSSGYGSEYAWGYFYEGSSVAELREDYIYLGRGNSQRTTKLYCQYANYYEDHVFGASFTVPARTQYLIKYRNAYPSSSFPEQVKDRGASIALHSGTPTRDDYVFVRWNTKTDNTGVTYDSGYVYTADADLTLYGIWNAIVYFNSNGGSGGPVSQIKTYREDLTLSNTTPSRAGYVFWHWNTKADNSGTTYAAGGGYTRDETMTLYAIWNPIISYNANGGTSAPFPQIKTFNSDIRLSYSTPKRDGHTFSGWNTKANGSGTAYKPNDIYALNVALTLYAQWTKVIINPTISSMSVVRCDSSGTSADDGTYFKLTARWSVDTTYPDGNPATVTGRYKVSGTSQWTSITFSSGASGTSGTAIAIVSGVSTDNQYDVEVTVTDAHSLTASRIDILTRAKFVWDIKVGGEAMGIGSAAPQKGLEVGWESQFDENVTLLKNLVVGGSLTSPELTVNTYSSGIVVAATNGTVVSQSARVVGHVCTVYVGLRPADAVSAGSTVTLGTLQSGFRPALTQGFASTAGTGTVSSGGSISFRPFNALSTSSTVYVGLTFFT